MVLNWPQMYVLKLCCLVTEWGILLFSPLHTAQGFFFIHSSFSIHTLKFYAHLKRLFLAIGCIWFDAKLQRHDPNTKSKVKETSYSRQVDRAKLFIMSFAPFPALSLWSTINKNPGVSTGPLAGPFARLLAPLGPHCLLHLRAPLCSLIRLLTHSFSSWWESERSV